MRPTYQRQALCDPPLPTAQTSSRGGVPRSRVPGRRRHVVDAGSGSKVGVSVSRLRRPCPPCMSEAACRAPERPGLETVTLCVRLVRSFEHRNFRELVFHDVAVSQSVRDFMSLLLREIPTRAQLPPPFKKHTYGNVLFLRHTQNNPYNFNMYLLDVKTCVTLTILNFNCDSADTLKIIHQAHGAKTNELVVSLEDDEHLLLHDEQTLHDSGVRHETVLAFFLLADYNKYKMNPTLTW
ncbi:unnamed protein product [Lampetra planeri]